MHATRTSPTPAPEQVAASKARAAQAYAAGDAARDQGRISPNAHKLYEWLLRYAGARSYCWPGEQHLASGLGCSGSTV
ncbi:MAG TPA: hypothetical protein VLA19_20730, partial [Herpetosiphonaceae bacterium]|nr:hypothetical protein [Herpetosiphonaceae bacterium]